MREEEKLEKLDRDIEELTEQVKLLEREIENLNRQMEAETKPQKLSFDDLIQELAGAVVVALPISLSEEIWELATRLSIWHILLIYLFVLTVANLFVRFGNTRQWERQSVLKIFQLRLITSAVLSFLISAFVVSLLGIYPNFVDTYTDYLKVILLVSSFSLIGSLGLDMAK